MTSAPPAATTSDLRAVIALATLTRREMEVLLLITEGYSNHRIASTLYMAVKTVEGASSQIFTKLGLAPSVDVNRRVLAARIVLDARAAGLLP